MGNLLEAKQSTIKSTELVDIINEFRKAEGNKAELRHDNFMDKIKKEIETLEKLGLKAALNFKVGEYLDRNNQARPCFELNRDGMLQMLNSESTFVRFKTIEYINKLEQQLKLPANYKEALLALVQAEEEKEQLQLENKQQEQIINELQPKATYYDLVLQNPTLIPISVIAKDYGMSGTKMNELLHDYGIQYKMGTNKNYVWLLYSKHQDKGYTFSKTQPYIDSRGVQQNKPHTYWTQKGRLFIYDLLKQHGIYPLIEREAI